LATEGLRISKPRRKSQRKRKTRSGPVSRVLSRAVISLGRRLPAASSDLPEGQTGRTSPRRRQVVAKTPRRAAALPSAWSCSGWGLPSQAGHPACWWALTSPFHPYLLPAPVPQAVLRVRAEACLGSGNGPRDRCWAIGGLFSVALSL